MQNTRIHVHMHVLLPQVDFCLKSLKRPAELFYNYVRIKILSIYHVLYV